MSMVILSREEFKEAVFKRDKGCCVVCGAKAKDAHHIIDRGLFPDGGYYIDNGASLCEVHHEDAEKGKFTPDFLREVCNISIVILPPGLDPQLTYNKWGEVCKYVKYPRTYHFDWSDNLQNDDRKLESIEGFIGQEVIMTEKLDGESCTMYSDFIHARSLDSNVHPTRYWVRNLWGGIKHDIPPDMRICGENLYAKHSIKYTDLPSFFMVFNIWVKNYCLSWDETIDWCNLLGLEIVPVLWRGGWDEDKIKAVWNEVADDNKEGYVVRITDRFHIDNYHKYYGKFVRSNHVRTSEFWMSEAIEPNEMRGSHQGERPI